MSKVNLRPVGVGSRWLEVAIGERVFASFQDELLAKRFAQQLAQLKGIELESDPALAKSRPGSGTYAVSAGGALPSRTG